MAAAFRWIARVSSGLTVLFILLFFVGYLFVEAEPKTPGPLTTSEIFMFVGTGLIVVGLIAAWRWEAAGGITAVCGYVLFAVFDGTTVAPWPFLICLISAILFIISWRIRRTQRGTFIQKQS